MQNGVPVGDPPGQDADPILAEFSKPQCLRNSPGNALFDARARESDESCTRPVEHLGSRAPGFRLWGVTQLPLGSRIRLEGCIRILLKLLARQNSR